MKKRLVILMVSLIVFLPFNINVNALASEIREEDPLTKEEFESSFLNEINSSNGDQRQIYLEEYEKYNSLSKEEQSKLIEYLNDDELMEKLMTEYMDPGNSDLSKDMTIKRYEENESVVEKTIISEDIFIEEYISDKEDTDLIHLKIPTNNILSGDENRVATWNKNMYFFGIKVMQHTSSIKYTRTAYAGWMVKVRSSDHAITQNFTLNNVVFSGKYEHLGNREVYSETNMTVSLIFKGSWTYVSGKCRITVDVLSFVDGYCKDGFGT